MPRPGLAKDAPLFPSQHGIHRTSQNRMSLDTDHIDLYELPVVRLGRRCQV